MANEADNTPQSLLLVRGAEHVASLFSFLRKMPLEDGIYFLILFIAFSRSTRTQIIHIQSLLLVRALG